MRSSLNTSEIDLYSGCTINFRNPSSFLAITTSFSKFSMNGDNGNPSSFYIRDWFLNYWLTNLLHYLQTLNSLIEPPKSLECINMPQMTFSSSRSSSLKLFFFYSNFFSTLKCYFMSVFKMLEIRSFRSLIFCYGDKKSMKLHYYRLRSFKVTEMW